MFKAGCLRWLKFVVVVGFGMAFLNACAVAPTYKEGLIINNKLQEAQVKAIANASTDFVEFAGKIYAKPPIEKGLDHVTVNEVLSDVGIEDYWDNHFYKVYCSEKGGELLKWSANRNFYAFNFRGLSKKIVACEKDNAVESVLLYESYTRQSTVFPYEVVTTYAKGTYLQKFIEDNKLEGYVSKNGFITFPMSRIFDKSGAATDSYTVIFNYQNNSNQPVEINLINSYVTIGGTKYNLSFTAPDGKEIIEWTFYRYDQESVGVFAGPEGNKQSKLRFNPGQPLYGEFRFKIPGKTKIFEKDMDNFVFNVDGIPCDQFSKVSYYDASKSEFSTGNDRSKKRGLRQ